MSITIRQTNRHGNFRFMKTEYTCVGCMNETRRLQITYDPHTKEIQECLDLSRGGLIKVKKLGEIIRGTGGMAMTQAAATSISPPTQHSLEQSKCCQCGWEGPFNQRKQVPSAWAKEMGIQGWDHVCPECGHDEFFNTTGTPQ